VGARREDITCEQRMQIAVEVLKSNREHGRVVELARSHKVWRKTIYEIGAKGKELLFEGLNPGQHGPQVGEKLIAVNRDRRVRASVVLTEVGVSQREISFCLGERLDTSPSVGWINGERDRLERAAAVITRAWQPEIGESLAGDEIYAHGQPDLLVVGNESLDIYGLSRHTGQLQDVKARISQLQALGQQLQSWSGRIYQCINSLLRPFLAGRKQTDQGCLELFRFLHNVRPFQRGKRAGFSPAQLVGLDLPDDPLSLLGLKPKVLL